MDSDLGLLYILFKNLKEIRRLGKEKTAVPKIRIVDFSLSSIHLLILFILLYTKKLSHLFFFWETNAE